MAAAADDDDGPILYKFPTDAAARIDAVRATADGLNMDDETLKEMAAGFRPVVDEDTGSSFMLFDSMFIYTPHNIRRLAQITPMFGRIVDSLPGQDYTNPYVRDNCAIRVLTGFVHVAGDAIDVFFPYVGRLVHHLVRTVGPEMGKYGIIQAIKTIKLLDYFSTEPAALDEMLAATPDTVDLLTDIYRLLSSQPGAFNMTGRLLGRILEKQARGRVKACRQSE